jgi:hypothetical protein
MAAMVVAMYSRLVRVARVRQASPLPIEDLLPSRGNPIRHKDCLAMIREVGRSPRDEQALADAILRAAERWGARANLTLSFMFLSVALNVVAHDPSVSSLDALLAEFFIAEEIDLIYKGEA